MVAKELTTTPCRCDEAANRTKMGQRHRKAAPAQGTTQRRVSRLLLSYCFQVASFQHCHSSSHIVSSSSGLSIDEEFIRLRSVISQKKEGGTLFARRLGSTRCLWLALSRACVTSGRRKIGAMSTTCWRLESPGSVPKSTAKART